ncbi:carboxypeptidase-like regulatory domain-containing protein [Aequorivita sp. SDUM287046]|uniref:Carboxypeptidase-like regulatory domain-containing protein n=1 Tax=Aequorivita aurantiaca TaxID=3053356 RepID=A0ABT8DQ08_9FLAO|nr:carboxypeptidase-like regulatory domain-containing protein [Aequorivita aurantiaca]MDN3725333.1 carboxypeptidase-like regulatory domain-containing protein [Aequorivita aurantiaca]
MINLILSPKIVAYLIKFLITIPLLISCSNNNSDDNGDPQAGFVTGIAKDGAGAPLSRVKVLIDHNIFFNSGINTTTNNEGKYKVNVPNGSWYAFATHEVDFNNKRFTFYLHPDNASGFGGEGAIRNFEWKLAGIMPLPLSGKYGGLVTIDNYPGVYINESEIEFEFTPLGLLIDGSEGATINRQIDISSNIEDIPIGRYELKAEYLGIPIKFRRWNSQEAFVENYIINFEPLIDGQCNNCAKLEYYWEP